MIYRISVEDYLSGQLISYYLLQNFNILVVKYRSAGVDSLVVYTSWYNPHNVNKVNAKWQIWIGMLPASPVVRGWVQTREPVLQYSKFKF